MKKYLEGRESEVVDIMITLFSQEEIWDMQVRSERREAAEKAAVNTMKATAKKMIREGRIFQLKAISIMHEWSPFYHILFLH